MKLDLWDSIPEYFFELPIEEALKNISNPTLVHIKGQNPQPLFVSTLLHGNELSGIIAVRNLLKKYLEASRHLPRDLYLLIGNPKAAQQGVRHLDNQPDYNRIWHPTFNGPERSFTQKIHDIIDNNPPIALIDIHNNTGHNPLYSCISKKTPETLYLASFFSRIAIYTDEPATTLFIAMHDAAPTIVLECGKSKDPLGIYHAELMIDKALKLERFPDTMPPSDSYDLYQTIGRIMLRSVARLRIGSNRESNCLTINEHIETFNFQPVSKDTIWAWSDVDENDWIIECFPGFDNQYFYKDNENAIRNSQEIVPAMLTIDPLVISQDCLGYLMFRINGL